jgi:hypothetical protein
LVAILSLGLALGLVAGPAVAVTHEMTGDVRAINADAKTFTVEQHRMLRGNKAQTFQGTDLQCERPDDALQSEDG